MFTCRRRRTGLLDADLVLRTELLTEQRDTKFRNGECPEYTLRGGTRTAGLIRRSRPEANFPRMPTKRPLPLKSCFRTWPNRNQNATPCVDPLRSLPVLHLELLR